MFRGMLLKPSKKDGRVYVLARDPITGRSRSLTVYGSSPSQVIELLRKAAKAKK